MKRLIVWSVTCAVSAFPPYFAGQAKASLIEFTFSGTVGATFGSPGVNVGDPFTLSYVFDPATPDTSPYPSIEGQYRQAAGFGMLVTVGDQSFFAVGNGYYDSPGFIIRVQHNTGLADNYTAQAGPQGGPPTGEPDITLLLTDTTQTALSSNGLPESIDLSAWTDNYVAVEIPNIGAFNGHADSFASSPAVPEPWSFLLLLSGTLTFLVVCYARGLPKVKSSSLRTM